MNHSEGAIDRIGALTGIWPGIRENEDGAFLQDDAGFVNDLRRARGADYVQGYFCSLQLPQRGMAAVIKSRVEPALLSAAVRAQVAALDPNQPIFGIRTMEQIRDESVATEKLNVMLLLIFAAVALALVGIYGLVAFIACYVPARRAAKVDPMVALRCD